MDGSVHDSHINILFDEEESKAKGPPLNITKWVLLGCAVVCGIGLVTWGSVAIVVNNMEGRCIYLAANIPPEISY